MGGRVKTPALRHFVVNYRSKYFVPERIMIEPGKTLQQRYCIDKQIGQGGMGAVYVATDERFGSTVAIKETLCMDDNYRKALEREARLLNSLKHSALPRVSDHFIEENGQFLVMEYIPGDDLAVILEQSGKPFPYEKVHKWAVQLLDALEFLHGQSTPVIHRDIKPQNLKLTASDQIVLLDFGLAKGNPTDAGFQTAAKSIFGYSRNYASLEQIQGTGTDPRSDLYSLAATLYHLATGHAPEDALTRAMAVLSNQPDPLVPANAINKEIPSGFAGILRSALDLNAAFRPASAGEMRGMLDDIGSYADRVDARALTVPNVDPGSQPTMLMPGHTQPVRDRNSAAKTEVLPSYISEETKLRHDHPKGLIVPRTGGLRRRFAVAGAALLLLLGGGAAGAFVFGPAIFSSPPEPHAEDLPVIDQPAADVKPAPEGVPAGSAESPAGPASASKTRPEKAGPDKDPVKQPAKVEKRGSADQEQGIEVVGPEDDPTVYIGNMKVREGRVETPDAVIDDEGITPKVPKVPQRLGPNGYPDPRTLNPAQRRRLLELRRRGLWPPAKKPNRPTN